MLYGGGAPGVKVHRVTGLKHGRGQSSSGISIGPRPVLRAHSRGGRDPQIFCVSELTGLFSGHIIQKWPCTIKGESVGVTDHPPTPITVIVKSAYCVWTFLVSSKIKIKYSIYSNLVIVTKLALNSGNGHMDRTLESHLGASWHTKHLQFFSGVPESWHF